MDLLKISWINFLLKNVLTKESLIKNAFPVIENPEKNEVTISNYYRFPLLLLYYTPKVVKCLNPFVDVRGPHDPDNVKIRRCDRCGQLFRMVDGKYLNPTVCRFHPKKCFEGVYQCCFNRKNYRGCEEGYRHVWSGFTGGAQHGYVKTTPGKSVEAFAIDCEMCFTTEGKELLRVSVVNTNCSVVYDQFVIPKNPVVDMCTYIHGITSDDLNKNCKPLKDVQNDLLQIINAESILIGHSLENDLMALKMVHERVVDTSLVFPHPLGPPKRLALKHLALRELNLNIQGSHHDSTEDAKVCVKLLKKLFLKSMRHAK